MKTIKSYLFATIVLVLFIAFCAAETAKSISMEDNEVKEAYYQELEQNYLAQVKAYLNEQGYFNSGVTMTRTETGEGVREYSVLIHNSRISRLSEAERESLREGLEGVFSELEECQICHEFLVADL